MGESDFGSADDQGLNDDEDDEDEGDEDQASIDTDVFFNLINTTPVSNDQPIDEGITSGGDGLDPDSE